MNRQDLIKGVAYNLAYGLISLLNVPVINAQVIYFEKYPSQADFKIYVVPSESLADIVVYKVKDHRKHMGNQGKWEITQYPAQADWKVFISSYPAQADLKVYYTRYPSRARWRRPEKKIQL